MSKYKEFKDLKSCIEAVGNYGNLINMLWYLNREWELPFPEDVLEKLDEGYDDINRLEFFDILNMFDIEPDNYEYDWIANFLDGVEFTDYDFKKKSIKFIIKEILPNHEGWCD